MKSKVVQLLSRAGRYLMGGAVRSGFDALESRQMMAADLAVTLSGVTTAFDWLVPGDKVGFDVVVTNSGDEAAVGEVDLRSGAQLASKEITESPDLLFSNRRLFLNLAPGASATYKIAGKVPVLFTPGEYRLGAGLVVPSLDDSTNGSSNPVNDADESNNVAVRESLVGMYYRFGNWYGTGQRDTRLGLKLQAYVNEDGSVVPETGSDDQVGGWDDPRAAIPSTMVLANMGLTGAGRGELTPNGDRVSIVLNGTTTGSVFASAVKSGSKRMTFEGDVTVNGSLRSLKATGVSFVDSSIEVTGTVGDVLFTNMTRTELVVGGTDVAMKFAASDLEDFSLRSGSAVTSFRAGSWTVSDTSGGGELEGVSVLRAPWLGQFSVTRDGTFDMYLSGSGARNGVAISKLAVGGVASGDWSVRGSAGVITLGSTDENFYATVRGGLASLSVNGDLSGVLTALSMTKVAVKGDVYNATVIAGAFIGDDLDAGGEGLDADETPVGATYGVIGSLAVKGGLIGSSIYCACGATEDGSSLWVEGQTSALRKLTVTTEITESVIYAQSQPAVLKVGSARVVTAEYPDVFVTI